MASLTHNTDVNWRACSSMPLRCASIPVSHTPIYFTDRTKRTIHGNRFHAADLTSMIRHTSWLRRRTRSMKWYLGLSARPSFLLSSLCLHQRSQTPPWENNHEAVIGRSCFILLQSPPLPRLRHLHSVLPSRSHSILMRPPIEFVPEERFREERSRTVACFYSAILTVLRNRVWDLAMQMVTRD